MELNHDAMLERFLAADASANGLFVTGVTTTGIYCLPACKAKKPRPENVRFFARDEDAERAGFRPCRRCRPDDFRRDHDPELEASERLAARMAAEPGAARTVRQWAAENGFGVTRLTELFHRHFHLAPAAFLQKARVDFAAAALATSSRRLLDIALDAGFASASTFHAAFRREIGLSPAAYRRACRGGELAFALPPGYRSDDVFAYQRRDPRSVTERAEGRAMQRTARLGHEAVAIELHLGRAGVKVEVRPSRRRSTQENAELLRMSRRFLGLELDPNAFERQVARQANGSALVASRRGLRIPLTADPFEALTRAIVGQVVSLAAAASMWRKLAEGFGEPVGTLRVAPTAAALAGASAAQLRNCGLTRQKVEALRVAAVAQLDHPFYFARCESAVRVERRLLGLVGVGRWTAAYVLLRGYGFGDAAPIGDSALATGLERFLGLAARPSSDAVAQLMQQFSPHRSLATAHLWRWAAPPPEEK